MQFQYQKDFAARYADTAYDEAQRRRKGLKIVSVLRDHFGARLAGLRLLDVGCSTGFVTDVLAGHVECAVGVDLDASAVRHAGRRFTRDRLRFSVQSAMQLGVADGSFDVVTCAHIYEHVPDAPRMMREIHRVLRPGGACFFAASNRMRLIEPHYRLPLLSVIPKPWAHLYLRVLRRGTHYYESHRTLAGLRRLTRAFEIVDYTARILEVPERFHAEDLIRPGSVRQKLARALFRLIPALCPTYIWLLRKA